MLQLSCQVRFLGLPDSKLWFSAENLSPERPVCIPWIIGLQILQPYRRRTNEGLPQCIWQGNCNGSRCYLMWALRWQGIVDFIVVSVAIYLLMVWGQQARALRIAVGIVGLRAAALLAQQFDLVLTAWVFDAASIIAFILLLVIFQPELRHALLQLDFGIRRHRARIDPFDVGQSVDV